MATEQSIRQASGIADFYNLLGIMLRLPQTQMVESFFDGSFFENTDEILNDIGLSEKRFTAIEEALDDLKGQTQEDVISLAKLRHSYTTLFTHPITPRIFIYESQFLFWEANPDSSYDLAPRLFVNPAALDAERRYQKAGLSRSTERNESADHISTELEFMARLYAYKASLLESGDPEDEIDRIDAFIEEFNHYHFEKWGVAFFSECATSEIHPLYQALGVMGKEFLAEMLEHSAKLATAKGEE